MHILRRENVVMYNLKQTIVGTYLIIYLQYVS